MKLKAILILLLAVNLAACWGMTRNRKFDFGDLPNHSFLSSRKSMKEFHSEASSVFKVDSYHGYVDVNGGSGSIFYWLFPPKNAPKETAPLLVWFTGGPGCSSELGLLFELGPFNVTSKGEVVLNPYSWNDKAHLLFIDQPVGTGYSRANARDYARTEDDVSNTMLEFFDTFFTEVFPEFQKRKLYLSGESFAGNYLPHISNRLFNAKRDYINLQGVAIGNGWANPVIQFPAYAAYANRPEVAKFINFTEEQFNKLKPQFETCSQMLQSSPRFFRSSVASFCQAASDQITDDDKGKHKFNVYDITKPCIGPLCYDLTAIINFLSSAPVLTELQADKFWIPCSGEVGSAIGRIDENNVAAPKLIDILEAKLPVLVYHGVNDYSCNWVGGEAWTRDLHWSGQEQFAKQDFKPEGDYGEARTFENFKFLKVYNAGHMVPNDQPAAALTIINNFMGLA